MTQQHQRFEYFHITLTELTQGATGGLAILDSLNRYGRDGWELCAVIEWTEPIFYFKRTVRPLI